VLRDWVWRFVARGSVMAATLFPVLVATRPCRDEPGTRSMDSTIMGDERSLAFRRGYFFLRGLAIGFEK